MLIENDKGRATCIIQKEKVNELIDKELSNKERYEEIQAGWYWYGKKVSKQRTCKSQKRKYDILKRNENVEADNSKYTHG